MRKFFLFCIVILSGVEGVFSQTWLWAKKSTYETSSDGGYSICTDGSGNAYVTGYFEGPLIHFGSIILHNGGMYLVKYDAAGNVLWAKEAGGSPNSSTGLDVTLDINGNIFVTGVFSSTIILGSDTLTNKGSSNIFLAKYDTSGSVLWAKGLGGNNYQFSSNSVSADPTGNVFISGYFDSPTLIFESDTLFNTGASNMFIAKYDSTGNFLWVKSASGSSYNQSSSNSTDRGGNVFVTGWFATPTITFGSISLTGAGLFLVKYDSSGNVLWVRGAILGISYGGAYTQVNTDSSGNIFLTGTFYAQSITFGAYYITNYGVRNTFLVKYDTLGNVLWANGPYGHSYRNSVSADDSGNVFIAGNFDSPSMIFGLDTLINLGQGNIFLAKYNASGNELWAKRAGGSYSDDCHSVSSDRNGNAFVTGSFSSSTITFGLATLLNGGWGGSNSFIAKMSSFNGVGINAEESDNLFLISPNPTNGIFQINSSNLRITAIDAFNVYGEKIYTSTINSQSSMINLDVPSGIYFLYIKTKQGSSARKIIIQK